MAELQIDSMYVPQSAATGLDNEPVPPLAPAHVLVIDDETMMCAALSAMLRANGYQVVTAQSGKEAAEQLRGQHFEVAITDLVMPEMDGIQIIAALKELDPDLEVIVLTGHAGVESAAAAIRHGACDYLLKPITMPQLCAAVARALEKRRSNTSLSLCEASPTLLAALETQEPILAVLKLAQGTMRATAVGLALVPPEGTGLHVELSRSDMRFGEAAVKRLAVQAMQAREVLRYPSFETGHPRRGEAGIPAGSILAFPLEVRGALLGTLVLWREENVMPFTVFELRSGEVLAAEIAIALDNAHLSHELSQKTEELETAHSAVARAEANARAIINAAQEAIILFDKAGVVWDLNPKALEMFGRSREETAGHNMADFAIPPRDLGHFREYVERAYQVGRNPADKEESDCAYLLEEIPKALTQTLDGVNRVATIVRAMKDFAHPETKEKAAADLNKAIQSTLIVVRNELKYVADVETDFGNLPLVLCNISDLTQVFLNLLVNAAHAIGDVVKGTGEKGKIRVRTVAEGKTVLVSIADTGCGIPEGIRSKIFDPFFTTKEVGRGTGQGLAIARSVVVERHKGTLTFESEVGKGTSFYIRLPVESGEHSEETRVP
jgi:signal transduction histidine kinase/CheY-like chemotaxis protein